MPYSANSIIVHCCPPLTNDSPDGRIVGCATVLLKSENGVENVKPILGTATHPNLPEASIDVALMVDAYHEFEWPREMMERVVKSIAPDGRVVLLEYRGENPLIPIKRLHKMTQKQVKREMAAVGLQWRETFDGLPNQHLMVFSRPNAVANPNFVKE